MSVRPSAQGTPLIDDNVTHLCYYTMYNIGPENVLFTLWVCNPLIHGIITNVCDIIIYKRGPLSVADIVAKLGGAHISANIEPLRPRIQKMKKTRYQRNVKILIFCFLCVLI